jgi:hypothetical protein
MLVAFLFRFANLKAKWADIKLYVIFHALAPFSNLPIMLSHFNEING